jgi:hypothetical protein
MLPFIQKTWFLWWTLAVLFILRWFQLFSPRTDDEATFRAADSAKEKASTGSKQIPSGTASSLFT